LSVPTGFQTGDIRTRVVARRIEVVSFFYELGIPGKLISIPEGSQHHSGPKVNTCVKLGREPPDFRVVT
jgi:hypothetical protein